MSQYQQKKDKIKDYNKLIQLDDKYELHDEEKKKVTSQLEQQVQYLLGKKEREIQKKKRIKQMQEEFQKKRKMKIEEFEHKNQQSQKTKQSLIKEKKQKNKKQLQHVETVNRKAHEEYRSIVSKGLQKRKQFYTEQTVKSSKTNSKAETQQNFKKRSKQTELNENKLIHSQTSKQMEGSRMNVQNQMKQIQEKLSKAKNNHLQYKKQMIHKLNQKERHHSEIQEKIRSYSMIEEQKHFKELYGKNELILDAQERVKGLTQKHLNDRRKSFQQKIKKLHENIKYMESEKNEKFASLQNKLTKIYEANPLNRMVSNKSKSHRQRVLMNHMKIEEQKKQKASQILKKHSQMTAKNKIYKEKKDQILQAIKKPNPEINPNE